MYGSEKVPDDSERTAFRKAEKKYKLYYDDTYKSSKKYSILSLSLSSINLLCKTCLILSFATTFSQEKTTKTSGFI